ncbi:carbonic anhydrase 7-like isoform X2 [Ischnura elegans]|uniref:carbonic anhydrase 7-like isoform X2 n=1 Tax=Ischnura elegans TaxID=197161 RepID=UPI001ED8970E|nr:carbonic anhydrase 7-like isoform X2 [Ischnura elegans]
MDALARKRSLIGHVVSATLVITLLKVGLVAGDAHPFDYSAGPYGPDNWGKYYKTCSGKFQSPINIDQHDVLQVKFPSLRFHGFQEELNDVTIVNNGHTVMLSLSEEDSSRIKVSGGPLKGKYVFTQLHFHWGSNDSMGSEDSINNQSFPMELHMVFWKESYGSYKKALDHHDGLTVLAFFYEIVAFPNHSYKHLINVLHKMESNGSRITTSAPSLDSMLSHDRIHYFTYHGSLTTPPCNEIVIWIDFIDPIPLSHAQVEKFRKLIDQNHRPTQPLGDRTIHFNLGPGEHLVSEALSESYPLEPTSLFIYFPPLF